ncbi:MAG: hypothetical protein ACI4B9_05990 [Eggerthellaceae bacterium]
MIFLNGHKGFGIESEGALTVAVRAQQSTCCGACQAAALLREAPMSRRNDAYTAIYFYRYC